MTCVTYIFYFMNNVVKCKLAKENNFGMLLVHKSIMCCSYSTISKFILELYYSNTTLNADWLNAWIGKVQ